jgi:hypothetical protein
MPNFFQLLRNARDNTEKCYGASSDFEAHAYDNRIDEGWAINMRELRRWIIAFLVIEAAWMTYLLMAFSATEISVDEQSGASNFGTSHLMTFVMLLFSSIGLWLMAALARVSILAFKSIPRH